MSYLQSAFESDTFKVITRSQACAFKLVVIKTTTQQN
jgi:hypothetical protein